MVHGSHGLTMDNDYSVHNFAEALFIFVYRFFRLLYLIRLVLPALVWLFAIGLLIVQWIDTIVDMYGAFFEKGDVLYAAVLSSPLFHESCWFLVLISTSLSLTILLILPSNLRELVAFSLAVIVGACSVLDFFRFLDANEDVIHHSYLSLLQQWELVLQHLHTIAFLNAFLYWSGRSHMTLFAIPVNTFPSIYQSTANMALFLSLVLVNSPWSYLPRTSLLHCIGGWVHLLLGGLLLVISFWALQSNVSFWWTVVVGVLWGLYIKYANKGFNPLFVKSTTTSTFFSTALSTGGLSTSVLASLSCCLLI